MMLIFQQIFVLVPLALILAAGIHDILTMRVPNLICLTLFLMFWPAAWMAELRPSDIGLHVLLSFAVLTAGYVSFHFKWMGGGDGKLLAVVALWVGPWSALEAFIVTGLLGGMAAFAIVGARRYLPTGFFSGVLGKVVDEKKIPYGAAIAGGALVVFFNSPIPKALIFAA